MKPAARTGRDVAGAFRADGSAVGDELRDQDGSFIGVFRRRFAIAGSPVRGKKLLIRTPPSGTNDNKLVYLSSGVEIETPQNAGEDPRCAPAGSGSPAAGARLRVVGSGGDFTIDLPCLNWTANAAGTRYRYRDGTGATCKAIVMREGRLLKAVCKGPQIAYALGAPQGDVHVTLSTGDPTTQAKSCASFGALTSAAVVRDGSDGVIYKALDAGPGVCQ